MNNQKKNGLVKNVGKYQPALQEKDSRLGELE
jgi:hypothetical protein